MNYLQVDNLTKSFGDLVLFNNLSLSVDKDQRVALIARNGTGKTSLLRILAGKDSPDSGQIIFRNSLSVGYLEQAPELNDNLTVLESVYQTATDVLQAVNEYNYAIKTDNNSRIENAMHAMDALKAWDYENRVKQILGQLKIFDYNQKTGELSGGQKKRLALASVIINNPDILILDEPTNHLDLDMIEWLESYLVNSKCTVIMVTHDRYFLDRVCDVIYEIDNKQIYKYKGNYAYFLEKRDERVYNQKTEIDKAKQLYKKELDWMNRMPSARATKAKSRINSFYETEKTASQKQISDKVKLDVKTSRLGKKILDLYNLEKSFVDKPILRDFTYNFKRFEKVGIIGANGTGKTTLLNIITGFEPVDKGKIEIGPTIVFGYYTQNGVTFDDNKKVIEVVQDIAEEITISDGKKLSPTQFLNYFLFSTDMQYSYVNKLSGGERRRLYLLTVLMRNPNFLILDEPTNDLDIVTLNILEDYLKDFEGCVLIVSHDRYFMDKIVDHVFVLEGEGYIKDYPGNYTQYRQWKNAQQTQLNNQNIAPKTKKEQNTTIQKKKLTFAERKEYQEIETEISNLETEKAQLEEKLLGSETDFQKLTQITERLEQITSKINIITDRWLELSEYDL